MICKLNPVIEFIREYSLLEDVDDATITETFYSFPHCCSWDKGLGMSQFDRERIDLAVDKVMEILDETFEHEYTAPQVKEIAGAFVEVFESAGAPIKPVPFVIVMLARL